ncbi:MAG TPA: hypothetical protein VLA56_04820 [Pseudomonadales bacterium]|nr:hypothetical protein [Pseudomonadales bacterium]
MPDTDATPTRDQTTILRTTLAAVRSDLETRGGAILRAVAPALVVNAAIDLADAFLDRQQPGLLLASLIVGSWLAIATHRAVLRPGAPGGLRWDADAWRFLGYTVLLTFVAAIVVVLLQSVGALLAVVGPGALAPLGAAAGVILCCIFVSRVAIVLPAAAIGHALTPRAAFEFTRGHTATCVALVVVLPTLTTIVHALTATLPAPADAMIGTLVLEAGAVFTVMLLSHLYRALLLRAASETEDARGDDTP